MESNWKKITQGGIPASKKVVSHHSQTFSIPGQKGSYTRSAIVRKSPLGWKWSGFIEGELYTEGVAKTQRSAKSAASRWLK